jgi:hypothetical protein
MAAVLLLLGACLTWLTLTPAAADPVEDCTATSGALVAVDFGPFGGPVERGCDTTPTTGYELLHEGGFTTTGTDHDGPGFVCRIGGSFHSGTPYPTAATEACVLTPSASAYWSYWIAAPGQDDWSYSPYGATGRQLHDGDVDAWVYGGTDVGGSTGEPDFSPADVRAGTVTTSASPAPTASSGTSHAGSGTSATAPGAAAAPAARQGKRVTAGAAPDLAKAVSYLTSAAHLTQGRFYPVGPGSSRADFGLTIDGAYALAATGLDNGRLRGIVDFLDGGGKDGEGRTVHDWTGAGTAYASGGSLGKAALLAEAVDRDPRDFAGQDLIAALDKAVCDGPSTAPDRSCAAKGAYTYAPSVFSQSLAIIAQLRAGEKAAAGEPIAYLQSLQQGSGAWPSLIPSTNDSDVDSTAIAAMALDLAGGDAARGAVDKALRWIASRQLPDGGFPGAAGDSVNSAALAAQGLSLDSGTYADEIAAARAFLAGQQNSDGGFNVAKEGQRGSDVRASAQAVSGATGISFGELDRSLSGSTAQPTPSGSPSPSPSASAPAVVTPDDDLAGTDGQGSTPEPDGGVLASTGAQAGALALIAVLLVLAGWRTVVVTRRRVSPGGRT